MKVLYIATAYPRSETDVITPWLVQTVQYLQQKGIEITVFTSSYAGLGDQTVLQTRVKRFRYFFSRWEKLTHDETAIDRVQRGVLNKLLLVCYLFFGTIAVWRLCRQEQFDIIHVHWPLPHFLFGYVAAKSCRAPVVISFHGVELMAVRHKFKFLRPFLRWAISSSQRVTANSTHTVRAIQEIYNRPVEIIPFGATVSETTITGEPATTSEKHILFVGRLVARKGVRYLIEAAQKLRARYPLVVDIVGTGPERSALEKLTTELGVADIVRFHGQVTSTELQNHYALADVFVLPAIIDSKGDTEGLGVVLIEALTFQKPVVASSVGGIPDLVQNEKTGLTVPPADSEALAAAIARLFDNPEFARKLGAQGYQHVQKNYSWPAIIERLIRLYQEVLQSD